jgi:glutathione S-transferase
VHSGRRCDTKIAPMIILYDNALSPFARKVRLALELKQLEYRVIDGLAKANREALRAVNPRLEVPAIDHDGMVVVSSADIIAYLERRWPTRPLYPDLNAAWVHARAWERCSDTLLDAIVTNVSYWSWARREDKMPDGLLDAARRELDLIHSALERDLAQREFVSDSKLSIADVALFPHLTATRALGLGYDPARYPKVHAWLKRLRGIPALAEDLQRAKQSLADMLAASAHERSKIFWRGDRVEWMLGHGFHVWFAEEIRGERVLWPGPNVPAPRHDPAG